ncbi:MAG: hypothetical protein IJ877_00575 [Candidatus Gastranaerophilales bacterium]|nr:hypothetical protein [Candidatus Gastranaerophilales bacterium]
MDKEKIKTKLVFWYSILWILLFIALYLAYGVYFVDTTSTKSKWVVLFSSAIALLLSTCKFLEVSFYKYADENLKNEEKAQNKANAIFCRFKSIVLVLFLAAGFGLTYKHLNTNFSVCAFTGILSYILISKLSSMIFTKGTIRANDALLTSVNTSLKLSFNTSVAISFMYWGIFCALAVILFHIYKDYEALIGFACGISASAFYENLIALISKTSLKNTDDFIKKYEHLTDKENPVLALKNVVKNYNFSMFFETYFLSLMSSIVMGATTAALMGAFLPIVISANAMFSSIISILFSKINKTNNVSKMLLKNAVFIALITAIMTYIEVFFWLGKDFIAISHSVLIGTITGIIALYINKDKKIVNDLQKMKQSSLKLLKSIGLILIMLIAVFILAQGMTDILYALYGITLAVFGFNLIVIIPTVAAQDVELNNKAKSHLHISSILITISAITAYSAISQLEEADILNPVSLISLLAGALLPVIAIYFVSGTVLKQAKKLILLAKRQVKSKEMNSDLIIFKSVKSSTSMALFALISIGIVAYLFLEFLGYEALLTATSGICLTAITMLFRNNPITSELAGIILRYNSAVLLGIAILLT